MDRWGCMLRTVQSLLATALQRVGDPPSDPIIPSFPPRTLAAHTAHARLLSWFLDAPAAPFGVHWMGRRQVRMWGCSLGRARLRGLLGGFFLYLFPLPFVPASPFLAFHAVFFFLSLLFLPYSKNAALHSECSSTASPSAASGSPSPLTEPLPDRGLRRPSRAIHNSPRCTRTSRTARTGRTRPITRKTRPTRRCHLTLGHGRVSLIYYETIKACLFHFAFCLHSASCPSCPSYTLPPARDHLSSPCPAYLPASRALLDVLHLILFLRVLDLLTPSFFTSPGLLPSRFCLLRVL
ncbi:hypothetical protein C8R44DRAFT_813798 [Mycena epipterygia]|nr:hypothetical protein C8R44DRAFT_813798 [Mycena epipterygia]